MVPIDADCSAATEVTDVQDHLHVREREVERLAEEIREIEEDITEEVCCCVDRFCGVPSPSMNEGEIELQRTQLMKVRSTEKLKQYKI